MNIKIIKFNKDLIIPTRKHYNDAGLDCYCCEDIILLPIKDKNIDVLISGLCGLSKKTIGIKNVETTYKIPLGFGLDLPNGYVALIKPRSSMNMKGVITYEGIIDSGYKGEIQAVFTNLNDEPITFKKGDRICQLLIVPISIGDLVENLGEERGNGGFGSTGK